MLSFSHFQSCPVLHDPIWGFVGKDSGMVCHFVLQPISEMRKTELNKVKVTCPGLPSWYVAEAGFDQGLPDSRCGALSSKVSSRSISLYL